MLDNITRRIETGNRRDLLLQTLTQGTRASLASMRAAIETIASFPDMDKAAQDRFIGIIGEEARRLSGKLDETVGEFADSLRTEWPLEDMRGADLIAAARRRIETRLGLPTKLETVDESIWLNVDSYSLMQAHHATSRAGCARSSASARSASGSRPPGSSRTSTSSGPARRWAPRRRWRGRRIRWSWAARRAR